MTRDTLIYLAQVLSSVSLPATHPEIVAEATRIEQARRELDEALRATED